MSGIADLLGAIRRGDARSVGDLLAAGPDLANARDEHANSPLLIATYTGKQDIVRLLLERGARASFFEACALGLLGDVRRHLPLVVGGQRLEVDLEELGQLDEQRRRQRPAVVLDEVEVAR